MRCRYNYYVLCDFLLYFTCINEDFGTSITHLLGFSYGIPGGSLMPYGILPYNTMVDVQRRLMCLKRFRAFCFRVSVRLSGTHISLLYPYTRAQQSSRF